VERDHLQTIWSGCKPSSGDLCKASVLATLPGRDADGALAGIVYAVDTLKMDGVSTFRSIHDVYLGEPQFDPCSRS
jgi:hypothetical protein